MKILKYSIWFFIIGILTLSSFNNDNEQFRLEPLSNEKIVGNSSPISEKEFSGKKQGYFFNEKENLSIKGKIYDLKGVIKIPIDIKRSGDLNVFFSIYDISGSDSGGISVDLVHKSKRNREKLLGKKELVSTLNISQKRKFRSGDDLILTLRGKGKVLISDPVVSISIKNSYVFLIVADTLRADYLELYGNKDNISDNITEFSKDSVVFDNCYSTSSWTLPAHISLFTGNNVYNHWVYNSDMALSDKLPIYPEVMFEKNYLFSINGGIFLDSKYGYFRGFDYYKSISWKGKNFNMNQNINEVEKMFKKNREFVDSVSVSNVFSFLHTYQVHSPYQSHKGFKYSESLSKKGFPKRVRIPQSLGDKNTRGRASIFRNLSERRGDIFKGLYKAEIEFFDHHFGEFVNYLKSIKIYDKSTIILLADHGEEFFDHKAWGHGHSLYNELIRIPLIIKFPGSKYKGIRVKENASIIDIFPTLFDYLKIDNINSDGQSLMGFIKNKENKNDRLVVSVIKYITSKKHGVGKFPQKIAVIWKNFKLIYNFRYSTELLEYYSKFPPPQYTDYELYDLDSDKNEKNNIVGLEKHNKVFSYLKNRINRIKRNIFNNRNKAKVIDLSEKNKSKLKSLGYL